MVYQEIFSNFSKITFSNRYQRVTLNGSESSWRSISAGVPQGSVLGPLLFLVYINDLTENIKSQMRLFADDSSIFTPVKNVIDTHEQLVKDLETVSTWGHQWKMVFNPDITKQAVEVIFSVKKRNLITQILSSTAYQLLVRIILSTLEFI